MPDNVDNNNSSGISQLRRLRSTRYQVSRSKKYRERKKRKWRNWTRKQQRTYILREQTESRGHKVAVHLWYDQSYDVSSSWTTEARRERPDGRHAKMRAEPKPSKTREDRNEVVGFRSIFTWLVIRGDPVWHRIAMYVVVSYPISCDITRYDRSIYYLYHILNLWEWYRRIVSRRYMSRYRTLFFAQSGALRVVHQDSKKKMVVCR